MASKALFDRRGWFAALQTKAQEPYPEGLRRAVVAKNFPILRNTFSAYAHQIQRAVARGDRVSINYCIAALLAIYFDVLFAIDRMPHPGDKRLARIAEARCDRLPAGMKYQVDALLDAASTPSIEILECADLLIDGLEALLRTEALL
ncbi:MAG: DUF4037 domain-containing protein [Candidatus Competibacter sp.]